MPIKVVTGFAGSFCVIYRNKEHFIDCRSMGTHTRIECIKNGKVYRVINELNERAPEVIVQTIREELVLPYHFC